MTLLKDKVAVVTGGSSGIGRSIAGKFSQEGAKTAIFGRNSKKLEQVAHGLKNGIFHRGDVTQTKDLEALYKKVQEQFGKIDVLVANAGIAEPKHVSEVDEEFFDAIVNTNYKGLYFTIQRALPYLNDGASIILISSAAAHTGWPAQSVYASAKAAVSYLAKGFSADLISRGIRVNTISPGFIETEMYDEMRASNPKMIEMLAMNLPSGRFGSPEEIADAALFLASSKSSYVMGADLLVDGALSAIFQVKS